MNYRNLIIPLIALLTLCSCNNDKTQEHNLGVFGNNKGNKASHEVDLEDIQANGEIIILTLYGPNSYFKYRGEEYGEQYILAKQYARHIGVSLRIDLSRNDEELFRKLKDGEGDIIACGTPVAEGKEKDISYCGAEEISAFIDSLHREKGNKDNNPIKVAWCVRANSTSLSNSLSKWLSANKSNLFSLASPSITYNNSNKRFSKKYSARISPQPAILNERSGIISKYDYLFKKHAPICGWDWRLIAAQCHTESSFDTNAVSWMGAMGLMQLMPQTASDLGITERNIFDPETNVRGGVKVIERLTRHYAEITDRTERIKFILGAYNAGAGHIDDARRLTAKHGLNPNAWNDNVEKYAMLMSNSEYYNDPLVKNGYFRGDETTNYVKRIMARWEEYKAKIRQ